MCCWLSYRKESMMKLKYEILPQVTTPKKRTPNTINSNTPESIRVTPAKDERNVEKIQVPVMAISQKTEIQSKKKIG